MTSKDGSVKEGKWANGQNIEWFANGTIGKVEGENVFKQGTPGTNVENKLVHQQTPELGVNGSKVNFGGTGQRL